MTLLDLAYHAIDTLWRSRLRSVLTVIGIVISVGFLITMVSLGTGLEQWINEDFVRQDLFASLRVSPKVTETEDERGRVTRSVKHLTDEAYEKMPFHYGEHARLAEFEDCGRTQIEVFGVPIGRTHGDRTLSFKP